MKILTVFLILVAAAWAGCIFDDTWDNLQEGDCLNGPIPEGTSIERVDTVSCDGEYEWRVVGRFETPERKSYPGEDFYTKQAQQRCDPRATDFLYPLEEDWARAGRDRTVICIQNSFGLSVKNPAKLDRLVAVLSLDINDCYKDAPETDYLLVEHVGCTSRYDYIVRHRFEVHELSFYPALDYLDMLAAQECPEPWDYFYYPDPETWGLGDRTVICVNGTP